MQNLYKKENFKPEIKPMVENLQDELYQLENKQAKGAKLDATLLWLIVGGREVKLQMQVFGKKKPKFI